MEKQISNILTRFTTELGYDFSGSRGHQAAQIIHDEILGLEPVPVVEPEPVVAEQPPVVAE